MSGEERDTERQAAESAPAVALGGVRPYEASESRGEPHVRLDREAEIAAQAEPRSHERRDDRPELDGGQPGETRDRQGFAHPRMVPTHSGRAAPSQSAPVA
jgi:hypothetical protein